MSIEKEIVGLRNRRIQIEALGRHLANYLFECGALRTCLNCDHWSGEPNEICNKFKARPPARIIVLGCSEHSDEIPF